MDSQAEVREHDFDQEVNAVVERSKRKLSESQLKALGEGRRKRWLGKSKTSDMTPVQEENASEVELESSSEGKSDPSSSESEGSNTEGYLLKVIHLLVIVPLFLMVIVILG